MEKKQELNNLFGLIGKNISYSFSQSYFTKKFEKEGLTGNLYTNFDIEHIKDLKNILENYTNLRGLNVTIPYKEAIIPFLDELNHDAEEIGAVNTIKISEGKIKGYNTDHYGFRKSLEPFLDNQKKALILGTGGASKAIAFVFRQLGINATFVSRNPNKNQLGYKDLDEEIIRTSTVIVNCTPLGTFPNISHKPPIPYEFLTKNHLLYDLIYNPDETAFLKSGKERACQICNGLQMLKLQAEKSWEIWNS